LTAFFKKYRPYRGKEKEMKSRNLSKMIFAIVVLLTMSFNSPVLADNMVDINVSKACVINPRTDSLSSRILFKFDLPSMLSDKRIDYAEVVFQAKIDTLSRYSVMFAGFPVTTDWNNATASWSNPWTKEGGDYNDSLYEIGLIKARGDGEVRFDITRLVRGWQQGSISNYGLMIKPLEEERKIKELVHPTSLPQGVFAKVRIYFSYTHP
jgi:hypothetical protein